ncbi:MAG TPA: hypothetical protein VM370_01535 [Candidatus Thermoplasmatota archaeon]|nr:hypothetical protein [Candidatus Thermoplasmatota archaeon]
MGALAALLLIAGSAPLGLALATDHCDSGIQVLGRSKQAPIFYPHVSNAQGVCVDRVGGVDADAIPAAADQLFVRVNAGLSASWRNVTIELHGLGFEHAFFDAPRQQDATGAYYELAQWANIPGGAPTSGEVTATLRHVGYPALSVTYAKASGPATPVVRMPEG